MIHLEGMGLLGVLTAWRLEQRGVDFTWSDREVEHTAWKACTGACYPAGDEHSTDRQAYLAWLNWLAEVSWANDYLATARYWVDSQNKSLPHGLPADYLLQVNGKLREVSRPSVHVNAQGLVTAARTRFADKRRASAPLPSGDNLTIIAHGFNERCRRYLWGWTALVELEYDAEVFGPKACFYLRKHRFAFAYAYPQPGTALWYAGSTLLNQRVPLERDPAPNFWAWRERFHELAGGAVRVGSNHGFLQGWRPAGAEKMGAREGAKRGEQRNLLLWRPGSRRLLFPPMTGDGFRHFPVLWSQLAKFLQVDP